VIFPGIRVIIKPSTRVAKRVRGKITTYKPSECFFHLKHFTMCVCVCVVFSLPFNPSPSKKTGVDTTLIGNRIAPPWPWFAVTMFRTSRKPRCWKKWRRKAERVNRDATLPVDIHEPPCGKNVRAQRQLSKIKTVSRYAKRGLRTVLKYITSEARGLRRHTLPMNLIFLLIRRPGADFDQHHRRH